MLKEIRKHIEEGNLSFIIGAGFSKNVSNKYLSWVELLTPMIMHLYPERFEFEDENNKSEVVWKIIDEVGYLGIASEYVRRKGYHEAIDIYIEKHTPYLEAIQDNKYVLKLDGEVVDDNPSIECHKKLLKLGAKNIFTFNYDNTLETIAGVESSEHLLNQQYNAGKMLKLSEKKYRDYEEISAKFFSSNDNIKTSIDTEDGISLEDINSRVKLLDNNLDTFEGSIEDIRKTHKQNTNQLKGEIAIQKSVINDCKEKRSELYQLIKNSTQISVSDSSKNIYKLHGSLRTKLGDDFGFDGDRYRQYIITKEDYEEYPLRHEAFVNLMKISLLKGVFCLIGFSGDDPNFRTWISWVKDILDKDDKQDMQSRSIYFINSGKEALDEGKQLALKNNYIEIVNLYELFPDQETPNERVNAFLDSLQRDKELYDTFEEGWKKINFLQDEYEINPEQTRSINTIFELNKYNRIPKQFEIGQHYRTSVFSHLGNLLKNKEKEICSKLVFSAIKGELVPIDMVLGTKEVETLKSQSEALDKEFEKLIARSDIFNGKILKFVGDEDLFYEAILSHLFNLKFSEAKSAIMRWNPISIINQVRKYLVLSVLEGKSHSRDMRQLLNINEYLCIQDYKYVLDILSRMVVPIEEDESLILEELQKKIERLKRSHFHVTDLWNTVNNLLSEVRAKSGNIPFGNKKNVIHFNSYDVDLINSAKVLQIFIEFGIPTAIGFLNVINKKDWQVAFENLFIRYPIPCLYYSLLYGKDEELLTRIGQKYIYSFKVNDLLPEMLINMLNSLLDEACPQKVREAIYILAPIFMRAVDSQKWQKEFVKVYETFDIISLSSNDIFYINPLHDFILKGVSFSCEISFKHSILRSILTSQSEINEFGNRLIIASMRADDLELNQEEISLLLQLCKNADSIPQFYVLLNLKEFIEADLLIEKFLSLPDKFYDDHSLLMAVSHLSRESVELQNKLKSIIIDSPKLWRTGISEDFKSVSHYSFIFRINKLQGNLPFTSEEIMRIYRRMLPEFNKISMITKMWGERKNWTGLYDWSTMLMEMQTFLIINMDVLSSEKEYSNTKRKITKLLNRGRGGNKISALLIDDENTNRAIEWMAVEIKRSSNYVKNNQYDYFLLASKIITKNSKYLNSCFVHFGWVIKEFSSQFRSEMFFEVLESILMTYKPYFCGKEEQEWNIEYAKKPVVEHQLLNIYEVYELWGGESKFWKSYTPRYFYG